MWDHGVDLAKLADTIAQIKALGIRTIVILGAVPVWKRSLPHSIVNHYRLRHSLADRFATGISGPEGDERMRAFSSSVGVDYVSARQQLCNADGCLTRVGPAASDVVTSDTVHLTDSGSVFLIEAIKGDLFKRP